MAGISKPPFDRFPIALDAWLRILVFLHSGTLLGFALVQKSLVLALAGAVMGLVALNLKWDWAFHLLASILITFSLLTVPQDKGLLVGAFYTLVIVATVRIPFWGRVYACTGALYLLLTLGLNRLSLWPIPTDHLMGFLVIASMGRRAAFHAIRI